MTDSKATPSFADLSDIAVQLVEETARIISAKRAELTQDHDIREFAMTKSSAVDPVTIVDNLAEDHLAERIEEMRPDDGIVGEEGTDKPSTSGISWVIDPIDGTVNFLYGLPNYAVSVAAARDGDVVAGAVINVVSGEVYSAAKGEGATVRDEHGLLVPLHASAANDPATSLVATGFGYVASRRAAQAQLLTKLLPRVRDIRRMGSAALDLCALAAGKVDIYYEHGIHCWDYAAGSLIAAEAGARCDLPALSMPGKEGHIVFAAAPGVFDSAHELFSQVGVLVPIPA